MTSRQISTTRRFEGLGPSVVAVAACALLLAACGDGKKDKPVSQVAAKVNKEELSVHQVNHLLQRQPGIRPENAESVSRQILERLIDQELALQQAEEAKVDRDPVVMQAVNVARREIVSRAYLERIGDAAVRPGAEEVKKYYDEQPALFKDRRIYQLQEVKIEAKAPQIEALQGRAKLLENSADLLEYLRTNDLRFSSNRLVRAAEQLPLTMVDTFAKMRDGQATLTAVPGGAEIVFVVGSQAAPIDETKAQPAIQQFLLNERKRQLIETHIKSLRQTGRIEYVGKFAEPPASAATEATAVAGLPAAPKAGAHDAYVGAINKETLGLKR